MYNFTEGRCWKPSKLHSSGFVSGTFSEIGLRYAYNYSRLCIPPTPRLQTLELHLLKPAVLDFDAPDFF